MIYVASPYSSPVHELQVQRYNDVARFVDNLVAAGFVAFSPILYCRPIALRMQLKMDANTWMGFNMSMLRRADVCYVLQLPGWDKSKGVAVELNVCKMLGIPVVHYGPDFQLVN